MDQASADALLEQLYEMNVLGIDYRPSQQPKPLDWTAQYSPGSSFFSLPAELRNAILRHALEQDFKPTLLIMKLPAMCRVSRRMRAESLPIFFALNTFIMEVVSPAVYDKVPDPQAPWRSLTRAHFFHNTDLRFAQTGKLLIRPEVSRQLESNHDLSVRNLDLVPVEF